MEGKEILYEILESRENRALIQEELLKKYKGSLISFTLNIPGPTKDSPSYRRIHDIGMEKIISYMEESNHEIKYFQSFYKKTGSEGFIIVDIDSLELKRITVKIEEIHQLGRIFDMDVFDSNHNQISRKDLGIKSRRCLLCDEDAKVCARQGTHSIDQLLGKINELYDSFQDFPSI